MGTAEIFSSVAGFILGGGLMTLVTLGSSKKKADVEVKVDEIKALHDTIDMVYKPIIDEQNETIKRQNLRIQELDAEVKALRQQIIDERSEHQKELADMQKQILAIARTVGVRTTQQLRDKKTGKFIKANTEENED